MPATSAALALEHRYWVCSPAPNKHRTLGGFFLRSLQEFEGFAEDGIFWRQRARKRRLFLRIGRAAIVIAGVGFVFGGSADNFGRHNAFLQDGLSIAIVIIGNRQKERGPVVERNQFLFRGQAKSALANDVPAVVRNHGGRQHFGCSRGRCVDQHGNRRFPDHFAGIGRENLRGNRLAAQCRQGPRRNKKLRDGNRFRNWSTPAFAKIQDHFTSALFFRVHQPGAYFIGASWIQRRQAKDKNIRIGLRGDNFWNAEFFAHQVDFVWISFAAADDSNFYTRARLAMKEVHCLAKGHI